MFNDFKKCVKCGRRKKIIQFHFKVKSKKIRKSICQTCLSKASKKRYENKRKNPEAIARKIVNTSKKRAKKRYIKLFKRQNKLKNNSFKLNKRLFDLDYKWVLEQREKQNNKCYYTGIEMIWSTGYIDNFKRINPGAVTIERINSSKGYTKDNCVLACWWANCSKGAGTYEELIRFSLATVKHFKEHKNDLGKFSI